MSRNSTAAPKRQRTGALQDASRSPGFLFRAPAFWSAAALRRFSRRICGFYSPTVFKAAAFNSPLK
jgi:hypothetical protein